MTSGLFSRWDPWWWYRDVPSTEIVAIHDDAEGFRVILNAENCPPTRVTAAPGRLIMFRVYDEISLVGLNPTGLVPGHPFYKAEASKLLEESASMNSLAFGRQALHYAIYTRDRCVYMICTAEPRFVLLREFAAGRYESERPEDAKLRLCWVL